MLVHRNKRVASNTRSKKLDENDKFNDKSQKTKQMRKNVIGFLFLIIILIIMLFYALNKEEIAPTSNPKLKPKLKPKQQPVLIIVASVNGGTSTFNQILMHNFKHFFHGFRTTQDMYYWLACIPKDFLNNIGISPLAVSNYSFTQLFNTLKQNKNSDFKTWDVSFNKLQFLGCEDIDSKYHCNLKCTHDDYMEHIGFYKNAYSKYKDIFFENGVNSDDKYTFASDNIHYFYDRTSGYNSLPYIPVVLAANYPHSKLLYIVRDPLTQIYSRFRIFDEITSLQKGKKELLNEEANRRFKTLLQFVQSEAFSKVLVPLLLKEDGDGEEVENDIIIWYHTLWSKKGLAFKEERIWDICPYVNILLFVKTSLDLNNFKLIQFEWATDSKLLLASIYIYCWTVYNEYEYANNCVGKYTQNGYDNLDEIMFNWDILERNAHFGKLKDYEWNFSDLDVFDNLIQFFEICDLKLVKLIQKYPIVLGGFELKLWTEHRKEVRQKMLDKKY